MLIRDLTTQVTLQIVEGAGSYPRFSLPLVMHCYWLSFNNSIHQISLFLVLLTPFGSEDYSE